MPTFHTAVTAWQKKVDEVNQAQKDDLKFEGREAVKKLTAAVESLNKQLMGLRERIEVLEAEDRVGGTPYSDGPLR